MGIQNGSISLCRYKLLGAAKRPSIGKLNAMFEPYRAGPLKLKDVFKEDIAGWVRPVGLEKVDVPDGMEWDLSHSELDDGFLLRIRQERRRVPGSLIQLVYKQKFAEIEQKTGKPPGPKDRRDLKDQVKRDLLARALPAVGHVDGFWRDRQGELMVFTTGKKQREAFENLFMASFATPLGLTLVRLDPPLLGLSAEAWSDSDVAMQTFGRLSSTTPVTVMALAYP